MHERIPSDVSLESSDTPAEDLLSDLFRAIFNARYSGSFCRISSKSVNSDHARFSISLIAARSSRSSSRTSNNSRRPTQVSPYSSASQDTCSRELHFSYRCSSPNWKNRSGIIARTLTPLSTFTRNKSNWFCFQVHELPTLVIGSAREEDGVRRRVRPGRCACTFDAARAGHTGSAKGDEVPR